MFFSQLNFFFFYFSQFLIHIHFYYSHFYLFIYVTSTHHRFVPSVKCCEGKGFQAQFIKKGMGMAGQVYYMLKLENDIGNSV